MQARQKAILAALAMALYGTTAGFSADPPGFAGKAGGAQAKTPAAEKPEPGSPGDTLTREDARMAYLVYKLLDKNGKIKGANLKRGAKLFYQNCRPCHGEDGRRLNFEPMGRGAFIGQRARDDMPTFWYQMNFGDDERGMEPYIDELTLEEMTDIAGYAQTLP